MKGSTLIDVLLASVFLTCAVSPGETWTLSMCTAGLENIVLTRTRPIYLTTPMPETDTGDSSCSVQVRHNESSDSRNTILRLKVTKFKLAGQDPCDPTQEHLKIVFGISSAEETTIVWCGGSYAPVLETRQFMRLTYVRGQRGPGFNISLSLVDRLCDSTTSLKVNGEPKYIYSPGYPNSYDVLTTCSWSITHDNRLLVESLKFHLEYHAQCNYDYVTVDGTKFCGDQRVYTTTRRGVSTTISFSSDHSDVYDGFVFRLVELPEDIASCTATVIATAAPKSLRVPSLPQGIGGINCYWLLDAGSDDSVVVLDTKHFYTTATCHDFLLSVYNGDNPNMERIVSGCAPQQMFQTIRSSGRYLYVDTDLINYSQIDVNVEFTVTSSLKNAPPRVMYAGFADSYVWMNLAVPEELGILLRGTEDRPDNYSTCIRLGISGRHQNPNSLNISDYIYAYSGWNDTFMELGTACGQRQRDVISYGSKIFIKPRQLGRTQEWRSVWLRYSLERFCTPKSVELQASRSAQTIVSDRYPQQYPNNAYCRWVINPQSVDSTQIVVTNSRLFPDYCRDNVTVYEYSAIGMQKRLADWCALQTPVIMGYAGGKLLVEFISDAKLTDSGFKLTYSSMSLRNECPTMASIIASDSRQNLSSPNYPFDYPNNLDCKWRITANSGVVEIKLLFVSIAQQAQSCALHDYLVIYDGPDVSGPVLVDLCGNGFIRDTFISASTSVVVHFRTDSETTAPGFQLQYSSTQSVDRFQCNKRLYVKDGEFEYISSPYYPNPYPQNTSCFWLVSAAVGRVVVLEVIDTQLPVCPDTIKVYDGDSANNPLLGKICNTNDEPRLISSQQFMYITFTANSHGSYKGFSFRLRSGQESLRCDGRVISLLAYPTASTFSSPNYPRNYPSNAICKWRFESAYSNMTVRLQVDDALLESSFTCNFDNISVYDGYDDRSTRIGRICGDYSGVLYGSSRFLYVQFTSDSSSEYRGFHATYTAVPANQLPAYTNTDTAKSANNVGAVVGGVLGGAVVLFVGFTLFLCYLKHSRRRRAQGTSPQRRRSRHNGDHNSTVYFMSPVIVNQMAPPPYPGLSNPAFNDVPPGYNLPRSTILAPPPLYTEVETPPPYCDTMIFSHPPSSPGSGDIRGSFNLSGGVVPPGFKAPETSQSRSSNTPSANNKAKLRAHPEPIVMLLNPLRRQGQRSLPDRIAAATPLASEIAEKRYAPLENSRPTPRTNGEGQSASCSNVADGDRMPITQTHATRTNGEGQSASCSNVADGDRLPITQTHATRHALDPRGQRSQPTQARQQMSSPRPRSRSPDSVPNVRPTSPGQVSNMRSTSPEQAYNTAPSSPSPSYSSQPAILQLSDARPTSPGQLSDSRPTSPGQFSDARSMSPAPITSPFELSPTQAQPASHADSPAVLKVANDTYV